MRPQPRLRQDGRVADYMTRLRVYDQLARAWWKHDRRGWHSMGGPELSKRHQETVTDVGDVVTALFESIFSMDKMLDAMVRRSRTDEELAFIGTYFLEDAADELGKDKLFEILEDMPSMSTAQKAAVRSGIAR